jgi:hypothetical protein
MSLRLPAGNGEALQDEEDEVPEQKFIGAVKERFEPFRSASPGGLRGEGKM